MAIKFDLPEDFSGVTVKEAKLSIKSSPLTQAAGIMTAFRLTQEWTEDGMTWENASDGVEWNVPWAVMPNSKIFGDSLNPGGMTDLEDTVRTQSAAEGEWENYNVTSIIQKFADGVDNYGFLLKAFDVDGLTSRMYHSSQYEDDTSLRPKLEIKYEDGGNPIFAKSNSNVLKSIQKIETASNISLLMPIDGIYEVKLTSISGKTIQSFYGNGKDAFSIDKSKLNSACYLLSVKKDGMEAGTQRLMIVK